MKKSKIGVIAAGVLALSALGSAQAAVFLDYKGAAYPTYIDGYITYNDGAGGYNDFTNKHLYVGGFNVVNTNGTTTTADDKSLIAWCVDIFDVVSDQWYNNGNPNSINNFNKLQSLVNQSYSKVNNRTTSAAFQLAVWEIINEVNGATTFNLGAGQFKASGGGLGSNAIPGSAIALANEWLGLNLAETGNYNIAHYIYGDGAMPNGKTQNLISMSPVPLPAAGWLMLSALGLGGWLTKRRRSGPAAV